MEDITLLQEYAHLVEVIEEALIYIETHIQTEISDQILSDVFGGLIKIEETNETIKTRFKDDEALLVSVSQFTKVVEQAGKLEDNVNDAVGKAQWVKHDLVPAFQAWKEQIDRASAKYIQH